MQNLNSGNTLSTTILQLEIEQEDKRLLLKEQFHTALENLRPINLIKNTFEDVVESPHLQENIVNTSLGLGAGYLSKLIFVGVSNSPIKKLLGTVLLFGITNWVSKHPETVKSVGTGVVKIIRSFVQRGKTNKELASSN